MVAACWMMILMGVLSPSDIHWCEKPLNGHSSQSDCVHVVTTSEQQSASNDKPRNS